MPTFGEFVERELSKCSLSEPSTLRDGPLVTFAVAGPAFAGKTSFMHALHARAGGDKSGLTVTRPRAAATDPNPDELGVHLFFDYAAPTQPSWPVFRVATVPGFVFRDAARDELFALAEVVIFLADAQPDRNDATLEMFENVVAAGARRAKSWPSVVVATKRDLPGALRAHEILPRGIEVLEACPATGEGVHDAFKSAVRAWLSPSSRVARA